MALDDLAIRVIEAARLGPDDMLVVRMPNHTDPEEAAAFREELGRHIGNRPDRVVIVCGVESITVISEPTGEDHHS